MNREELLRRKVEYATQEELLFMLLNSADSKFKKIIELWKKNSVEGTILAGKLHDCILELKLTLNVDVSEDPAIKEALEHISALYSYIIDEILASSIKRDFARLEGAHEVFKVIKDIFEQDSKNAH